MDPESGKCVECGSPTFTLRMRLCDDCRSKVRKARRAELAHLLRCVRCATPIRAQSRKTLYCPDCREYKRKESLQRHRAADPAKRKRQQRDSQRRRRRDPDAAFTIRRDDRARSKAIRALAHRYPADYRDRLRYERERVDAETLLVVEQVSEHRRYIYSEPVRTSRVDLPPLEAPTRIRRPKVKSDRSRESDRRYAKASSRALHWLRQQHADEFAVLFDEYREDEEARIPIGTTIVPAFERGIYGYPLAN